MYFVAIAVICGHTATPSPSPGGSSIVRHIDTSLANIANIANTHQFWLQKVLKTKQIRCKVHFN